MNLSFKIRRLLGYRLMNFIGRLVALFMPSSAMRKRFRKWFISPARAKYAHKARLSKLQKTASVQVEKVNGATTLTWNGLRFIESEDDGTASFVIVELASGEYSFAIQGQAIVIDIGMNYGVASLHFASRDDVQAVYAFEPVPAVYQRALSNFEMNPQCADKIRAHNFGLGDGDKEVSINFSKYHSGMTTTVDNPPKSLLAKMRHQDSIKVQVQIKDAAAEIGDIIKRHPRDKIVMKCDCEGAEKAILARLDEVGLLSAIDVVIMEYHFGNNQIHYAVVG